MNELGRMTRAGESIMIRELNRQATAVMAVDHFAPKGEQPALFDKFDFVEGLTDPQAN